MTNHEKIAILSLKTFLNFDSRGQDENLCFSPFDFTGLVKRSDAPDFKVRHIYHPGSELKDSIIRLAYSYKREDANTGKQYSS